MDYCSIKNYSNIYNTSIGYKFRSRLLKVYDITEILLNVTLSTITLTHNPSKGLSTTDVVCIMHSLESIDLSLRENFIVHLLPN
jgi:hypothetical protein